MVRLRSIIIIVVLFCVGSVQSSQQSSLREVLRHRFYSIGSKRLRDDDVSHVGISEDGMTLFVKCGPQWLEVRTDSGYGTSATSLSPAEAQTLTVDELYPPLNFELDLDQRSTKRRSQIPLEMRPFVGCAETLGKRDYMEDTMDFHFHEGRIFAVAVYDGHGGWECSEQLAKKKNGLLACLSKSLITCGVFTDVSGNRRKEIIIQEFVDYNESHFRTEWAGSTACVALLDTRDQTLFVANLGDSRLVAFNDRGDKAFQTDDQKPDDEEERARIYAADGFVEKGRVNGKLSTARAFGNYDLKEAVGRKPKVMIVTGDELAAVKGFVIGCDGVFDMLSSEDAAWLGYSKGSDSDAGVNKCAELIVKTAFDRKSKDNISALFVDLAAVREALGGSASVTAGPALSGGGGSGEESMSTGVVSGGGAEASSGAGDHPVRRTSLPSGGAGGGEEATAAVPGVAAGAGEEVAPAEIAYHTYKEYLIAGGCTGGQSGLSRMGFLGKREGSVYGVAITQDPHSLLDSLIAQMLSYEVGFDFTSKFSGVAELFDAHKTKIGSLSDTSALIIDSRDEKNKRLYLCHFGNGCLMVRPDKKKHRKAMSANAYSSGDLHIECIHCPGKDVCVDTFLISPGVTAPIKTAMYEKIASWSEDLGSLCKEYPRAVFQFLQENNGMPMTDSSAVPVCVFYLTV